MTPRIFSFIFLLLFCFNTLLGQSEVRGKDFYLAFPGFYVNPLAPNQDSGFELTIHIRNAHEYPLNVTIKNGDEIIHEAEILYSWNHDAHYFEFPSHLALQIPSEEVLNYGIQVITSSNVTLSAKVSASEAITDTSRILPKNSLGTEYVVMSTPGSEVVVQSVESILKGLMTIVATEDNTEIEIIPNFESEEGKPAGSPVKIILDEGQSYEMRPANYEDDITGTIVKSCAPIAVFSGSNGSALPYFKEDSLCCVDIVWEQMIPVDKWGEKYYTIPPLSPRPDVSSMYILKVVASRDSTVVQIDGEWKATLNAGEYYIKNDVEDPVVVEANYPIQVAELLYSGDFLGEQLIPNLTANLGDPAMIILQPIEAQTYSYSATPITTDPANLNGYVMTALVIKESDFPYMNKDMSTFEILPYGDDSGYVCAIINSWGWFESSRKFQVYEYLLGNWESYFHSGNYFYPLELPQAPELIMPEEICVNESIRASLSHTTASEIYDFQWDFGNGQTGTGYSTDYTYSQAGEYEVSILVQYEDCEEYAFTKTINVLGYTNSDFEIIGKEIATPFDTLIYTVSAHETSIVEWTVENGKIISETQNSISVEWNAWVGEEQNDAFISAIEFSEDGCFSAESKLDVTILNLKIEEGKCIEQLSIAPNPVAELLQITALTQNNNEFYLRIFNSIGQSLLNKNVNLSRGSTNIIFNVSDYPAGIYFLNIDNGSCRETIKWVKMR